MFLTQRFWGTHCESLCPPSNLSCPQNGLWPPPRNLVLTACLAPLSTTLQLVSPLPQPPPTPPPPQLSAQLENRYETSPQLVPTHKLPVALPSPLPQGHPQWALSQLSPQNSPPSLHPSQSTVATTPPCWVSGHKHVIRDIRWPLLKSVKLLVTINLLPHASSLIKSS